MTEPSVDNEALEVIHHNIKDCAVQPSPEMNNEAENASTKRSFP